MKVWKMNNPRSNKGFIISMIYGGSFINSGYLVSMWTRIWKYHSMEFDWDCSMLSMRIRRRQSWWNESRVLDFRTRRRTLGGWFGKMLRTEKEMWSIAEVIVVDLQYWLLATIRDHFISLQRPRLFGIKDRRKYTLWNDASYWQTMFELSWWCGVAR